MEVIRREGDALKIGEKKLTADTLFKIVKGEKKEYLSFDLTFTISLILKEIVDTYDYVESIKEIKTSTQWTMIESPTVVYGFFTRACKWLNLTTMMGLDENEEKTLESFRVDSIEKLYGRAESMDLTQMTLASSSVRTFKTYLETGKLTVLGKTYDSQKPTTVDEWRGYTVVDIPAIELISRGGYRGGITWGRQGLYEHCTHIDRRSMYPTTASYYPMIYGLPHEKREESDLEMVRPTGVLFLKKGCIPMIGFANPVIFRRHAIKGRLGSLLTDVNLIGDLWFYKFEWDCICEMYDFYGEITESLFFSTKEPTHLRNFFETCYQIKSSTEKGSDEYVSSKKRMNALYGRFAIRTLRKTVSYANGLRHQVIKETENLSSYHLPLGSLITAHARTDLIRMAMKIGLEYVLYMDTDSIFFKREAFKNRDDMLKTCNIGKRMGDWDIEEENVSLNVIGPKTYQTLDKDHVTTKCAGLQNEVANGIGWMELYEGMEVRVIKNRRGKDMVIRPSEQPHKISCRPVQIR